MRAMSGSMTLRSAARWSLTLALIGIVLLFFFSLRRAVSWDSPNVTVEISLMKGAVLFSQRVNPTVSDTGGLPPPPGWSLSSYGGDYPIQLSISTYQSRTWRGVGIPLWMPGLVVGVPAVICWWRDRRLVAARFWARLDRWAPDELVRFSILRVVLFTALHLAFSLLTLGVLDVLVGFFAVRHPTINVEEHYFPAWYQALQAAGAPILLFGAPLWGVLWAWLWMRWKNSLLRRTRPQACHACGYDLTGNISGRCPECGSAT